MQYDALVPGLALALGLAYAFLAFGVRIWLQVRRTGSTGVAGVSGRVGSVEWVGGVLFGASMLALLAAPILELAGVVEPIDVLDGTVGHVAGIVLAVVGIGATFYAQLAMGSSWRIGVDESEQTRWSRAARSRSSATRSTAGCCRPSPASSS
jgi:hypothetical protein